MAQLVGSNPRSGMMKPMRDPFRRVRIGLGAMALVLVVGTTGYLVLGFGVLDAVYQTITTVTTVGFTSPHPLGVGNKVFTVILILVGVGTALYTFSAVLEVLIEGHMRDLVRRRKMERDIAKMSGHVIVCGWGRVGREVAQFLTSAGRQVVVVDRVSDRLHEVPYASVLGDVTDDETLHQAGIERAATLVAALDTDSDNLYVTVAGKSSAPTSRSSPGPATSRRSRNSERRRRPGGEPSAARRGPHGVVRDPAPCGGLCRHCHARRHARVPAGRTGRVRFLAAVRWNPAISSGTRPHGGLGAGHSPPRRGLPHQSIARRRDQGG